MWDHLVCELHYTIQPLIGTVLLHWFFEYRNYANHMTSTWYIHLFLWQLDDVDEVFGRRMENWWYLEVFFAASVALSTFPMWIIRCAYSMLVVESFIGWPPDDFWSSGLWSERVQLMVPIPWPVWWEICWMERPESSKLRMRCIWAEDSFCIMSWGGKNEVVRDPVPLNILYHMILFAFICNNQQSHVICITSILKKSVQQNCSNEWLNCIM